jgi:Tol biopolymer transport system component
MKLWRAHADRSDPVQITQGDGEDFDPQPSPDGKWLAYVSAPAGQAKRGDVVLQIMPLADGVPDAGKTRELVKLVGGQGTLKAPAWSPDSKTLAFLAQD